MTGVFCSMIVGSLQRPVLTGTLLTAGLLLAGVAYAFDRVDRALTTSVPPTAAVWLS